MDEARRLVRFSLKRESQGLYVFSLVDGTEVQFADRIRARYREFEVVSGTSHFRLSSTGFSPPITLANQEEVVLHGTRAICSMCFAWSSDHRQYRLIGRRFAWMAWMIAGRFQSFHLHSNGRRVAYWFHPKGMKEIRGVLWGDIPVVEIASIVFGSMYNWDDGCL